MSEAALLQKIEALTSGLDALTSAVLLMAQQKGARLTSAQVVERVGRTRQTITSMVRRGDFPEPCTDGRWLLSDILEWEAKR
ncbi:hypothetical protein [Comamonas antarctica]|uniref:helix-turn-helix transcriptional regulator n=1 Tax=Comamonas antarctica TaxID=2743470 RepID=UPI0028EB4B35|nr:hypothetical protein [Comamonas antarctica]